MSPFFIVTTSRRPSRRVRRFCKELLYVIPNSVKVNRGKLSLDELYLKALELGGKRVILVSVLKGNPGVISFYDVNDGLLKLFPWIVVAGVKFFFEQEGRRNFSAKGLAVRFYDVSLERVAASLAKIFNKKTGKRIAACLPVHIFGHSADMEPIMNIAEKHGLKVCEDACQAIGTEYKGNPKYHAFMRLCQQNKIEQRFTRVRTPQTNGKAERVIRTLMEMWHQKTQFNSSAHRKTELIRFINYYNGVKPHKVIDGATPEKS